MRRNTQLECDGSECAGLCSSSTSDFLPPGKVPRAELALLRLLRGSLVDTKAFGYFNCNPRDFKDFFGRHRRRFPGTDCLEKRLHASGMTFVLPPGSKTPEAWKPITAQYAKVIQLKYPPGRKHLNTLFRKGPVAVGVVLNRGNRAVFKPQRNLRRVQALRNAAATPHYIGLCPNDPRADQETSQVNEVTSLSKNAPSTHLKVLAPIVRWNGPCIHQQAERLRTLCPAKELPHPPHMRREPAVESHKNDRGHPISNGPRICSFNFGELLVA